MSSMSALVEVLKYASDGETVPDEVFGSLSRDEQAAVRAFENNRRVERRWREITLSILRTATDLTRGQDRRQVLEELVQSARQVIRSDVAYISLNNPELGHTSVLTTSGVITEKFRNIEMPLGVGVLGLVASTRQAAWTSDHREDPSVTHVPEVDDAVHAEGIRGILGAPLVIGGDIIGALMVADRSPRSYTVDEIVVLDSLASLAAVALETSQLIEDLETNIAALQEANEETALQISQLQRLSDADSRLMDVLAKGTRTRDLDRLLREKFQAEIWFWRDDAPYPVNKGEIVDLAPEDEEEMRKLIRESRETGEVRVGERYSVLALSVNQRRLTAICVGRRIDETQKRILFRAAQTFATIILFREALYEAENRQVNDLLRKVVMGAAAEEDLARVKKMTDLDLRDSAGLHLVAIKSKSALPSARTLDRIIGDAGVVFEHGDHLCAVVNAPEGIRSGLEMVVEWSVKNSEKLYFGSVPFPFPPGEAEAAHTAACALASGMRSLGSDGTVATPSSFGSLGLLLDAGGGIVDQIIEEGVGKLMEYDHRHGTELTLTAARYFDCARSVSATAKTLYVHENTVRQRVDRITEILGTQWNTGPRAFDTHLALRAWQLRK